MQSPSASKLNLIRSKQQIMIGRRSHHPSYGWHMALITFVNGLISGDPLITEFPIISFSTFYQTSGPDDPAETFAWKHVDLELDKESGYFKACWRGQAPDESLDLSELESREVLFSSDALVDVGWSLLCLAHNPNIKVLVISFPDNKTLWLLKKSYNSFKVAGNIPYKALGKYKT